jgi:L-lysine exporter family protein LysE/ArgO
MMSIYLEGLALGAALIIAIGAQNAFVIRQGIRGEHVFAVATVCALVDVILITVGAAGVGTLIAQNPTFRVAAAFGGGVFLIGFGLMSVRRAWMAHSDTWQDAENTIVPGSGSSRRNAMLTVLGFSLLNPHVYLDTVVLLGGLAGQYDGADRVYFALGAMTASPIWFYGIGYGAIRVAPFFRTQRGTRLMEGSIAVIMFALAFNLLWGEIVVS